MNRLTIVTLAAMTCLTASSIATLASGNWQTRAYDATYSISDRMGAGTMRLAADGRGHALIENHRSSMNNMMLMDSSASDCYSVTQMPNGQKMAIKMSFNPESNRATTIEDMKRRSATSLGARLISGHPCHGFQYTLANATHQDWIGDDIDMVVEATSNGPQGQTTMTLQSFSPQGPQASAFVLPADAKVVDAGNLGQMYGAR